MQNIIRSTLSWKLPAYYKKVVLLPSSSSSFFLELFPAFWAFSVWVTTFLNTLLSNLVHILLCSQYYLTMIIKSDLFPIVKLYPCGCDGADHICSWSMWLWRSWLWLFLIYMAVTKLTTLSVSAEVEMSTEKFTANKLDQSIKCHLAKMIVSEKTTTPS